MRDMAITTHELAAVLRELAPAITGGRIQKIGEPKPDTILLDVRVPGTTMRLLISIDPDQTGLHLVTRTHPNPAVPPAFCRFLRARLAGARIDRIRQINEDRIVRLDLTASTGTWSLVAELLGRQADLLVIDGDDRVLTTYRRAEHRLGRPYAPPQPPPASRASPQSLPIEGVPGAPFPISAKLEERYDQRERELTTHHLTAARETLLRKRIKKQRRLVTALGGDLARAAQYERYARYGELLKSTLGRLRKGQTDTTVVDYFDETLPELTIPLDPAKAPQANMDDYFAKHRKFLTARKEIVPRIESIQHAIREAESELEQIKQGSWALYRSPQFKTPGSPARLQKRESRPERRGPFRRFTSADGAPIYVGRNARENDELTFTIAKSDDLWLHAQGVPGSHVIVRLEKGQDPPIETLRDAATLALLYSDLKKAGQGDVIYTRRKWIRKAKGAVPGSVTVTQEKSVFIRLDQGRLDALKQRSALQG
jgi:predicted ribosome quality control (RQC) complex YloA/Tae2 family protein